MKYILVPTDFSDCASFASDLAVQIASKTSHGVHFFTRLYIHPLWHELTDEARKDYPESRERIKEAEESFKALKDQYRLSGVPIETSFHAGDIIQNVLRLLDEQDIDLIVMGSSGADGLKEILFGSNAQKLVKYVPRPVVVVKHPLDDEQRELKNIIFASDYRESAKKPFEELIEFATAFGSHIHLLHVDMSAPYLDREDTFIERMQDFEKLAWKLPTTIHEVGDIGLEEGITHFAHEIRADMVAVARFGKSPLQRIMTGSVTEALVNHLDIPIMVINDPDMGKKEAEE